MRIAMTGFALGNWAERRGAARIVGIAPEALVAHCSAVLAGGAQLVPGYAPFCKHLFLANETETRCGFAPITEATARFLRSGYAARREGELAVLERWFEGVEAPRANWLDVILYSRAQIEAEAAEYIGDYPETEPDPPPDCDWGIVGVLPVLEPREPPMPPITQMRNALGRAEGGSGVAIDRAAYDRAVAFWQRHATIR